MTTPRSIPFFRCSVGDAEAEMVLRCLRSGWLTTGPMAQELERRFAEMIGCRAAVSVSSCTAAMHLALDASGIGPGDEVIVPTLTFVATAQAPMFCGATPVLVDCRRDDFTIDVDAARRAVTPRTRAIMPMHYAGHACDMDAIDALAKEHDLLVVEDAAHVITGWCGGTRIGARGNPTCFSFHATKQFTTGEGGMLTTNDLSLAERVRTARSHGIRRDAFTRETRPDPWAYDVRGSGHKCNLPDVLAALGVAQLDAIDREHRKRETLVARYRSWFVSRDDVMLQSLRPGVVHSHHLFPVLLRLEALTIGRDEVMRELQRRGIGTSLHYRPLHLFEEVAARCRVSACAGGGAEWVYERLISLPLYSTLTQDDVDLVASTLIDVLQSHARVREGRVAHV